MLTDRGLAPALGALADRAPLPVTIERRAADERLPAVVEAAAYYVVAEALDERRRSTPARRGATSRIERLNGDAVSRCATTGVGGADPRSGPGCAASPTGSRR